MGRGRVENLRTPSTEEARKIGRKGGLQSGISRMAKKTFEQEILDQLADGKELSAIVKGMIKQAKKGNVQAATFLRDTAGEKPVDKSHNELSGGLTIGWEHGESD